MLKFTFTFEKGMYQLILLTSYMDGFKKNKNYIKKYIIDGNIYNLDFCVKVRLKTIDLEDLNCNFCT